MGTVQFKRNKLNEAATPKGVEQAKKVKDDLISFARKIREYKDILIKRRTQIENFEINPSDKHIISHMYKELANMLIPIANEATDYAKKVEDIENVGQIRIGHFI